MGGRSSRWSTGMRSSGTTGGIAIRRRAGSAGSTGDTEPVAKDEVAGPECDLCVVHLRRPFAAGCRRSRLKVGMGGGRVRSGLRRGRGALISRVCSGARRRASGERMLVDPGLSAAAPAALRWAPDLRAPSGRPGCPGRPARPGPSETRSCLACCGSPPSSRCFSSCCPSSADLPSPMLMYKGVAMSATLAEPVVDAAVRLRSTRAHGADLAVGDLPLAELAERYGTPLCVLDEQHVRDTCRAYRRALPGAEDRLDREADEQPATGSDARPHHVAGRPGRARRAAQADPPDCPTTQPATRAPPAGPSRPAHRAANAARRTPSRSPRAVLRHQYHLPHRFAGGQGGVCFGCVRQGE